MPLNFKDIPKFTGHPTYRTHVEWKYLESCLTRWSDRGEGTIAAVDLDPDFQRPLVWTPEQKTAYVEYVLSGGMSGREIYFNCKGWTGSYEGPFVLVDGKQRLNAVREFLADKLPVFDGHYLRNMEGRIPTDAHFIFCVNDLKTRAEVLKWYLEMNSGGTPHTPDEINKVRNMLKTV